jgi:hypothetical protein
MMGSMMRRGAISGDGSTLNLDFTTMTATADLTALGLTFTRGSTGTRINASGFVETMSNNVARFDHDPSTGAPKGLLIEGASTNLLLQSNDWNTTWNNPAPITWNGTSYTTAPNGTNTAKQITVTAGSSSAIGQAVATGTNRTMSVWLKAGSLTSFSIGAFDAGGTSWGNNADSTCSKISGPGSVTQQVGGLWSITGLSTTEWTRIQIFRSTTYTTFLAYPGSSSGTINGTAFMWGMQMEAGNGASSLIPTGASTATRVADECVMTGTNFSSWFNAGSSYSMLFRYSLNNPSAFAGASVDRCAGTLSVSGGGNRTFIHAAYRTTSGSGDEGRFVRVFDTGSLDLSPATLPAAASNTRLAFAVDTNNAGLSAANQSLGTDSSCTILTGQNQLELGKVGSSQFINGCISLVKYWPTRLPNATLQSLTT